MIQGTLILASIMTKFLFASLIVMSAILSVYFYKNSKRHTLCRMTCKLCAHLSFAFAFSSVAFFIATIRTWFIYHDMYTLSIGLTMATALIPLFSYILRK